MSQAWHPDEPMMAGYASGRSGATLGASMEAHLIRCAECRGRIAKFASDQVLADGRARLRTSLTEPRRPFLMRVARRLGMTDHTAVLLAESRTMSDAWLLSIIVVLAFAALASDLDGRLGDGIFLLVAPLVPVVGVSIAYANTEPTLEKIVGAAPYSSMRLLLLRTASVLVVALPLSFIAGAVSQGPHWLLVAWLLPSLAVTLLVLALSTWFAVELTASGVALLWAFAVGGAALRADPAAVVTAASQPIYLGLAAVAATIIALRVRGENTPGGVA